MPLKSNTLNFKLKLSHLNSLKSLKFIISIFFIHSPNIEVYDYVRAEIGERMVDRMFDFNRELKIVAELGCNRGFITRHELPDGIEQYYLCDSSEKMLQQAKNTAISSQFNISTMQLDEETPKVSIDHDFYYE